MVGVGLDWVRVFGSGLEMGQRGSACVEMGLNWVGVGLIWVRVGRSELRMSGSSLKRVEIGDSGLQKSWSGWEHDLVIKSITLIELFTEFLGFWCRMFFKSLLRFFIVTQFAIAFREIWFLFTSVCYLCFY